MQDIWTVGIYRTLPSCGPAYLQVPAQSIHRSCQHKRTNLPGSSAMWHGALSHQKHANTTALRTGCVLLKTYNPDSVQSDVHFIQLLSCQPVDAPAISGYCLVVGSSGSIRAPDPIIAILDFCSLSQDHRESQWHGISPVKAASQQSVLLRKGSCRSINPRSHFSLL